MRSRLGVLVVAIAAFAMSACTSSGGPKPVEKTGYGWFQARPLIMAGQRVTTARTDPFGSLKVPTSEDAFNNLSKSQQDDLANALRGVDCAHPPQLSEPADRVVCENTGTDAFLLGAPLFSGNDVRHVKLLEPTPSVVGWQISLSLTSPAAMTMSKYTSHHHLNVTSGAFNDVQVSAKPPCGPMATPCSDFTAFISHGYVITIPVWFKTIKSPVVIDGTFKEAFASRLAHSLVS